MSINLPHLKVWVPFCAGQTSLKVFFKADYQLQCDVSQGSPYKTTQVVASLKYVDTPATPLACRCVQFRILQPSRLTSPAMPHAAVRATPVAYAGICIRAQWPRRYERPSTRQHTQPTTYERSGPPRADRLRLRRFQRASHRAMRDLSVTQ